jgi:tetratricopeptide (TPR) repeat protein
VVTRQDLRQQLWDAETFVDFDVGLNSAIRKLRDALDESAENPRFIETLPRRGYRFIGSVQPATVPQITDGASDGTATTRSPRRLWRAVGALVLVIGTIGTLLLAFERQRHHQAAAALAHSPTPVPQGIKPEAYDAYLKGVLASGRLNYEGFQTGVEYFESAVKSQPDFAAAYAALADAQLQFLFTGPLAPREVIPKAEAAARKALVLDDSLANAHRVLAIILQMFHWDWEEGDREFRRAGELGADPSASVVSLIRRGLYDEAIAEAERACKQDPLSFGAQLNLGLAHHAAGDYAGAVAALRRAVDSASSQPRGHFQLGMTFVAMGRLREGISELETAVASSRGRTSRFKAYLGYAYAISGRREDARVILTELDQQAQREYVSAYGTAMILDALGEKDAALAALNRAYEDRAMEFAQAAQYPPFKTIAHDPRYEEIMRRVGVPEAKNNPSVRPADHR